MGRSIRRFIKHFFYYSPRNHSKIVQYLTPVIFRNPKLVKSAMSDKDYFKQFEDKLECRDHIPIDLEIQLQLKQRSSQLQHLINLHTSNIYIQPLKATKKLPIEKKFTITSVMLLKNRGNCTLYTELEQIIYQLQHDLVVKLHQHIFNFYRHLMNNQKVVLDQIGVELTVYLLQVLKKKIKEAFENENNKKKKQQLQITLEKISLQDQINQARLHFCNNQLPIAKKNYEEIFLNKHTEKSIKKQARNILSEISKKTSTINDLTLDPSP